MPALYDRAAPTFDQIGPRFFARFGRRLIELAELPTGAQVLDVGTGRGAVLFPAAQAVGSEGHVFGIDLSGPMLAETAAQLRRERHGSLTLARMDGENLAFAASCFDALVCGFAIHWLPGLERALAEFWRVLRPGGLLAYSTSAGDDERWDWYGELLQEYDRREHILGTGAGRGTSRTPEQLRAALELGGFVSIRVVTETFDIVYTSADEWWASLWTHGSRAPLEHMSSRSLDQFRIDALARLRSLEQADGYHEDRHVAFTLAYKPKA